MKTFILGIVTLVLLISLVSVNCIYVDRSLKDITVLAKAFPEDVAAADTAEISKEWDEAEKIISLTVPHSETDEIEDTIYQIANHIKDANESAYRAQVTALICQLEKLRHSEHLSFHRIF